MRKLQLSCFLFLLGLIGISGSFGCKRVEPPHEIQMPIAPTIPTTMPVQPETTPTSMPSTQPASMPATQPAAESTPGTW